MHFNRLDLNLLVSLDALLSERNVTRAAERLHISQPAMSGALQRLRLYLKDQLLEPAGHHRLQLTPRARQLAGPVKELLLRIQTTLSGEPEFVASTAERYFQMGMSSYCIELLGRRILADLRELAPNIRCRFHELSSNTLSQVEEGELDFCVTLSERSFLDPGAEFQNLHAEALFSDEFVVVASAKNHQASSKLSLEEYYSLPSVEVRIGDMPSIADHLIYRYEEACNKVAVVPGFHLALAMLTDSPLVTVAPSMIAEAYAKAFELKWFAPAFQLPDLSESLIWHMRNSTDPAHTWFRQRLKAIAGSLGPAHCSLPRLAIV
jgi:LysR family nod box-dependent transcriptional activator